MPFAVSDGVQIHYEKVGQGEPLLLVMGYGLPGAAWIVSLPYFTSRFEVVYFDNRGTGTSDAPEEGYEIEDFARDARVVLDAVEWPSAHVFGVSMGGMIAQQLALDAPERVRSLVLGCTTSGEPEERTPEQDEALRTLGEAMAIMSEDPERFARLTLSISYPLSFLDAHPELLPLTVAMVKAMPATKKAPEIRLDDSSLQQWKSAPRLGELTMPALVLHGTVDRLIPLSHAFRLFEGLPNVELRVFKGAGHVFQAQDMAGVTRGIAEWLAAKSPAKSPAQSPAPAS
jgi:3-oxoadipate enol-lactonase